MSDSAAPSDFLARVALSGLGAMPMVKPRLPSLFEDRHTDLGDEELVHPLEAVREPPPQERTLMPPAPAVTQPAAPPLPSGQAPARPKIRTVELPRDEPIVPTRAVRAHTPRAPASALRPLATKRNTEREIREPLAAVRPPMQPPETREVPAPTPEMRQRRAEGYAEPERSAPKLRQSADVVRREESQRVTVTPEPVVQQSKPVARPIIMPALRAVPSRREALTIQLPPAPPAINITIGRIDIRAATPPPTAPSPAVRAARQQPQSLDDYLKSRAGRS